MKNQSLAELATAELRVSFISAVMLLRKLSPRYTNSRRSPMHKADVALQKFCNELRNIAAESDQFVVMMDMVAKPAVVADDEMLKGLHVDPRSRRDYMELEFAHAKRQAEQAIAAMHVITETIQGK